MYNTKNPIWKCVLDMVMNDEIDVVFTTPIFEYDTAVLKI